MKEIIYQIYVEVDNGDDYVNIEEASEGSLKSVFSSIEGAQNYLEQEYRKVQDLDFVTKFQIVEILIEAGEVLSWQVVKEIPFFDYP